MNKSTVSYIWFVGGNGTGPAESYPTMGQSQQEANHVMLLKGNIGYLRCATDQMLSGLGTDNSLSRE